MILFNLWFKSAKPAYVLGTQPSAAPVAAAAAVAASTSPAAVPPTVTAQSTPAESTSSVQTNGVAVSQAVPPSVAATLPSVVNVAGQTLSVNTVTSQATSAKPVPGVLIFHSLFIETWHSTFSRSAESVVCLL